MTWLAFISEDGLRSTRSGVSRRPHRPIPRLTSPEGLPSPKLTGTMYVTDYLGPLAPGRPADADFVPRHRAGRPGEQPFQDATPLCGIPNRGCYLVIFST
jgi:hypothetical protein